MNRGTRHFINRGEEWHVGPLRVVVNYIFDPHEGDRATAETIVAFTPREGEGIGLGHGNVKLSMLEELKRAIEADKATALLDTPSEATIEQRLENDQARRAHQTGICPTCGSDV